MVLLLFLLLVVNWCREECPSRSAFFLFQWGNFGLSRLWCLHGSGSPDLVVNPGMGRKMGAQRNNNTSYLSADQRCSILLLLLFDFVLFF